MAHKQQQDFFEGLVVRFSEQLDKVSRVLEVGSQNINGSVRQYFPNATKYLGIDLAIAPDVDWVVPGELIELPNGWADIVISTECFEHCDAWEKVFINMIRIASTGSLVVITCASLGRPTHGTADSDEYSSPFTTSYYKNLGVDDIIEKIKMGSYFIRHGFEADSSYHDLYFWGIRSAVDIQEDDKYWEEPMSRLARAQGQLAQAAARHAAIQKELEIIKTTAEQARAEAEQARAEAEQAKTEAEQALISISRFDNSSSWRITRPARQAKRFLQRLLKSKP